MSDDECEGLQGRIVEEFGSVHRFCKLHPQLNRSTVYMVLNGRYGGNTARQVLRIEDALQNKSNSTELIFQAIKTVACKRCSVQGSCSRCDKLFQAQAKAVELIFSS
ncbi:MAG: hypothetical protein ACNI27_07030 [Desulfovibrio sp.]